MGFKRIRDAIRAGCVSIPEADARLLLDRLDERQRRLNNVSELISDELDGANGPLSDDEIRAYERVAEAGEFRQYGSGRRGSPEGE